MKRLLLVLALLSAPCVVFGQCSGTVIGSGWKCEQTSILPTATATSTSGNITPTGANHLLIVLSNIKAIGVTITVAGSVNAFTNIDTAQNGNATSVLAYVASASASTETVTVSISGGVNQVISATVKEFSGQAASTPLDVHSVALNPCSGAANNAPSLTASVANELVIGASANEGNSGNSPVTAPFTLVDTFSAFSDAQWAFAYWLDSSSGAFTGAQFSFDFGGNCAVAYTATFKPAGASTGGATITGTAKDTGTAMVK